MSERAVQEGFLEPAASSRGCAPLPSGEASPGSVQEARPRQCAPPQWSRAGTPSATPGASRRFPPQMLEQSLREEELRAQHRATLLRLRQKALEGKMRAERAWLEHQRR